MAKITYNDKVALIVNPDIADENKVTNNDMNEIKQVVNENDDKFLTNGLNVSNEVDEDYKVNLLKGKNLFNKTTISKRNGYLKGDNGSETADASFGYISSYIPVKPNTTYTLSGTIVNSQGGARVYYYNQSASWISRSNNFGAGVNVCTFTTPNNCYYIQFQYMVSVFDENTIQIEEGSTATTYEAYITPSIYVDNEEIYNQNIMNYSTNEQVIGKWIDGKPLYRKVYTITSMTNSNTNLASISDVETPVNISGFIITSTNKYPINLYESSTNYNVVFYSPPNNALRGRVVIGDTGTFQKANIIFEYTKTTD